MEMSGLLSVAIIVFGYGVVSRFLGSKAITAPMIFLVIGWIIGPDGWSLVDIGFEESGVRLLAEATLVVVLFADATRVDLRLMRSQSQMPARLLGIGMPLTIATGGLLAGWLVPGITMAEGFLLGAILAPTDAALGKAVISHPRVPVRIRQMLNVESGLNDGIALPIVTALVAVAAADANLETPAYWLEFALKEIGIGVLVGVACGVIGGTVIRLAWQRDWVTGEARQLATLAVAVVAFAAAQEAMGNGFIAAFAAGVGFSAAAMEMHETASDLAEDLGELATWMTFLFFGVGLAAPALRDATPGAVIYVVLTLTVVRIVPVAIAMVGTHCTRATLLFLGWFGPRGLASILFVLLIVDKGNLAGEATIRATVSLAVMVSVFAHGVTAPWGAARYGKIVEGLPESSPERQVVPEMAGPRRGGSFEDME